MDVQQAVIALLKSNTALMAIVKTISPYDVGQTTPRPYIAYFTTVPEEQFDHLRGVSGAQRIYFTFDIAADSKSDCVAIQTILRKQLHYYAGISEGMIIYFSKSQGEIDIAEPNAAGVEKAIRKVSSKFEVIYQGT